MATPHDTVIRIPHTVRTQFNEVQKAIEVKTQGDALASIVDWLSSGTPEALEAIRSIALLRLSRRMAKLAAPAIAAPDEAESPSLA